MKFLLIPVDGYEKAIELTSKKREEELKRAVELGTTILFYHKEYYVDELPEEKKGGDVD